MENFFVFKNPLIHEVALKLHDKDTSSSEYRHLTKKYGKCCINELAGMNILPTKNMEVETPLGKISSDVVDSSKIGIVSVLRAGMEMGVGMADVLPESCVSLISAWRHGEKTEDITAKSEYMRGQECLKDRFVILADPALATGSSLIAVLDLIKEYIDPKNTIICTLNSARVGVEAIHKIYPDVRIYSSFELGELNEVGYILNGPGDCGDRNFNTVH